MRERADTPHVHCLSKEGARGGGWGEEGVRKGKIFQYIYVSISLFLCTCIHSSCANVSLFNMHLHFPTYMQLYFNVYMHISPYSYASIFLFIRIYFLTI